MSDRGDLAPSWAGPGAAPGAGRLHPSLAARALVVAIHAYRGLRPGRPSPCRFVPSCSAFALEAVTRNGARRGAWLTLRRLARCRPRGGAGLDPVPD